MRGGSPRWRRWRRAEGDAPRDHLRKTGPLRASKPKWPGSRVTRRGRRSNRSYGGWIAATFRRRARPRRWRYRAAGRKRRFEPAGQGEGLRRISCRAAPRRKPRSLVPCASPPISSAMRRRRLLALAATALVLGTAAGRTQKSPGDRDRELAAWWGRPRDKEAADPFSDGTREMRRNLTCRQIQRREGQRNPRRQGPTGLARPYVPYYSPYRRLW